MTPSRPIANQLMYEIPIRTSGGQRGNKHMAMTPKTTKTIG